MRYEFGHDSGFEAPLDLRPACSLCSADCPLAASVGFTLSILGFVVLGAAHAPTISAHWAVEIFYFLPVTRRSRNGPKLELRKRGLAWASGGSQVATG